MAIAEAINAGDTYAYLAFTGAHDEMGNNQTLSYKGLWLSGTPAVLLINRRPDNNVGRDNDYAWDMSANPPQRYVKQMGEWQIEMYC